MREAECKRLPVTATKEERTARHRERMLARHRRRAKDREDALAASKRRRTWLKRTLPVATANLSRHHPDYGMSPAEHAQRKAFREGRA